jgi:peptidoglycan hydrolase-like protein with peptidoglycan-binding domain
VFVNLLERRLRELGYHITGVDDRYDHRTRDAVIAFNKVQGRPRSGSVTASTWGALASPKRPRPRRRFGNYHIEIDQTKQVIYVVRRGKVRRILHTSTGRNGYTRNGTFRVHRRIGGYSPGRLYYPSYFDGLRATHGWPEVPTYPASAGCARVPMWAARWMYERTPVGTVIHIYH